MENDLQISLFDASNMEMVLTDVPRRKGDLSWFKRHRKNRNSSLVKMKDGSPVKMLDCQKKLITDSTRLTKSEKKADGHREVFATTELSDLPKEKPSLSKDSTSFVMKKDKEMETNSFSNATLGVAEDRSTNNGGFDFLRNQGSVESVTKSQNHITKNMIPVVENSQIPGNRIKGMPSPAINVPVPLHALKTSNSKNVFANIELPPTSKKTSLFQTGGFSALRQSKDNNTPSILKGDFSPISELPRNKSAESSLPKSSLSFTKDASKTSTSQNAFASINLPPVDNKTSIFQTGGFSALRHCKDNNALNTATNNATGDSALISELPKYKSSEASLPKSSLSFMKDVSKTVTSQNAFASINLAPTVNQISMFQTGGFSALNQTDENSANTLKTEPEFGNNSNPTDYQFLPNLSGNQNTSAKAPTFSGFKSRSQANPETIRLVPDKATTAGNANAPIDPSLDKLSDMELLKPINGDMDEFKREELRQRLVAFYKRHNKSKMANIDTTLENYNGREAILLMKLREKYVTGKDGVLPPGGTGPRCFMDIEIGEVLVGTIVIKLYADKVPLAAENFRVLCTGELGNRLGKPLCYRHCSFHRVVPDFCVQGGDFTKNDGTGGTSIYPPNSEHGDMWGKFKDEIFMSHNRKGLLSMANNGANRNGSQFFFTLRAIGNLDGKHVVFGEITNGMDVVEKIAELKTDKLQRPVDGVRIVDCGEISEEGLYIRASEILSSNPSETPCRNKSPFTFGQSNQAVFKSSSDPSPFSAGSTFCSSSIDNKSKTLAFSPSQASPSSFEPASSHHHIESNIKTRSPTSRNEKPISQMEMTKCNPKPIEDENQHKEILTSFYTAHNPSKLGDVDKLLKKYKNREKEMYLRISKVYKIDLEKVTSPYNLYSKDLISEKTLRDETQTSLMKHNRKDTECPSEKFQTSHEAHGKEEVLRIFGNGTVRERVIRFYQKYNVSKLSEVDRILKAYEGQSDLMFSRLLLKYKLCSTEAAMTNECQKSDANFQAMQKQEESQQDGTSVSIERIMCEGTDKERLVRFYQKFNPLKLSEVDRILEAYKDHRHQLFPKLFDKYKISLLVSKKVEANLKDDSQPQQINSIQSHENNKKDNMSKNAEVQSFFGDGSDKERLIRFYEKYNPSKLSEVDRILEAYKGQRNLIFPRLFDKYKIRPIAPGEEKMIEAQADATSPSDIHEIAALNPSYQKEILMYIYKTYNPDKIEVIDNLMRKYKGSKHELFTKISEKYQINIAEAWNIVREREANAPQEMNKLKIKMESASSPCNKSFDSNRDVIEDEKKGEAKNQPSFIQPTAFRSPMKNSASNPFSETNNKGNDVEASSPSPDVSGMPSMILSKELQQNNSKLSQTLSPPHSFSKLVGHWESNPFLKKQDKTNLNLCSKKSDFLDSITVSRNNPFFEGKNPPASGEKLPTAFAKVQPLSLKGPSFLDSMKASKKNPFAKSEKRSEIPILGNQSARFLGEVKPSLNNPFATISTKTALKTDNLIIDLQAEEKNQQGKTSSLPRSFSSTSPNETTKGANSKSSVQ